MSYRKEKNQSLVGLDYSKYSSEKLQTLSSTVLENVLHGLCFSPYGEGQKPGDIITEAQIRKRLEIIVPYTKWIRSFSCTEGNDLIPKLAKEYGLKTLVGALELEDADQSEGTEVVGCFALEPMIGTEDLSSKKISVSNPGKATNTDSQKKRHFKGYGDPKLKNELLLRISTH